MARERRLFSEEFKREAVKRVGEPGASKAGIARDLGAGADLLGRWCREANVAGRVGGGEKVSAQEYERVRRELAKVKTERGILKNARLLRSRPQVKYGFIAKRRRIWPTGTMCRRLGVSTSGFYDWLDRLMSQHERENAQLLQAIKFDDFFAPDKPLPAVDQLSMGHHLARWFCRTGDVRPPATDAWE